MLERDPDTQSSTAPESKRSRPTPLSALLAALLLRLATTNPDAEEEAGGPETSGRDADNKEVGHPASEHGASSDLEAQAVPGVSQRAARLSAKRLVTMVRPMKVFISQPLYSPGLPEFGDNQ